MPRTLKMRIAVMWSDPMGCPRQHRRPLLSIVMHRFGGSFQVSAPTMLTHAPCQREGNTRAVYNLCNCPFFMIPASTLAQWIACWAHNSEVPGSRPGGATHRFLFFFFWSFCSSFRAAHTGRVSASESTVEPSYRHFELAGGNASVRDSESDARVRRAHWVPETGGSSRGL